MITPCTLIYRFVHSHDYLRNSPDMLGLAEPDSEGFYAQPLWALYHLNAPAQPHGADV